MTQLNRGHERKFLSTLRDLSGAPILIVLAMYGLRRPVGKKLLAQSLRLSYNNVSSAVDFLEAEGYIQRDGYRTWTLPNGQLPLPGFDTPILPSEPPRIPPTTSTPVSRQSIEAKPGYVCIEQGEICVQEPSIRVFEDDVVTDLPSEACPDVKRQNLTFQTSKNDVSALPTTTTTDIEDCSKGTVVVGRESETSKNDVSAELTAAFQEAGIGCNMWPELAGLSHVTPDYVRAHTAGRRSDPDPRRRTVGLQIKKMRDEDPAPQWCAECDGVGGEHHVGCSQCVPAAQALVPCCPVCDATGLLCQTCGLCRACCSCAPPQVLGLCPRCCHPIREDDRIWCPGCRSRLSQLPPLEPLNS